MILLDVEGAFFYNNKYSDKAKPLVMFPTLCGYAKIAQSKNVLQVPPSPTQQPIHPSIHPSSDPPTPSVQ